MAVKSLKSADERAASRIGLAKKALSDLETEGAKPLTMAQLDKRVKKLEELVKMLLSGCRVKI